MSIFHFKWTFRPKQTHTHQVENKYTHTRTCTRTHTLHFTSHHSANVTARFTHFSHFCSEVEMENFLTWRNWWLLLIHTFIKPHDVSGYQAGHKKSIPIYKPTQLTLKWLNTMGSAVQKVKQGTNVEIEKKTKPTLKRNQQIKGSWSKYCYT